MQALILEQLDGTTRANIQTLATTALPPEPVLVDIQWSSLNYKDALAITGTGKIVRQFPMIPGIDFTGTVNQSTDPRFLPGQAVLLTGWGVGETHWGGLAQQARVNGDWLLPLPQTLTARKAMIIGTAGLTAMLCIMALEEAGITPNQGDILVTGASGGVGSTAIMLLHQLGYQVIAVSGRNSNAGYLCTLGAKVVLSREEFLQPIKPLEKQRWAGAIDCVGSAVLANVLAQINYGGTVAACGLAGGITLPTTVMPFILRNIRLQGVDSVYTPNAKRLVAWQRLSHLLPEHFYQHAAHEITLQQVPRYAQALIDNQLTGRIVVKMAG